MNLPTEQTEHATGQKAPDPEPGANRRSDAKETQRDFLKKGKGCFVLERPGSEALVWERWLQTPDRQFQPFARERRIPPLAQRILTIPTSCLFAWPLWIATEGTVRELVLLELSGRHLLRKGMENSLLVMPVCEREDRRLVLAVSVEEPFLGEGLPDDWKTAGRFEIPIHTMGEDLSTDLMLWSEWGVLQLAFFRAGKPVWFCGVRGDSMGSLARRVAIRLQAEEILEHSPRTITITGVREELADKCISELQRAFPEARFQRDPLPNTGSLPAPHLPLELIDLPPMEAVSLRHHQGKKSRTIAVIKAALLVYLLLLIWGTGDLLIRHHALKKIRTETAQLENSAEAAKLESKQWQTLRQAIDPTTFALDLLSAVASPTQGGKVRLTLFSLESGRLQLSGEATDVSQAYAFIEQLKQNPLLQEYEWNAGQPQLAGTNSVRFDMEGTRHNAPTGPE